MSTELAESKVERASSLSIITNQSYMANVMSLAKMMASSKVTVPKHLQGNEGDCAAIAMQAMNWGMDPYVVAQKTHLVNGTLGYEAQLVNAVVQSSNAIRGTFKYEFKDGGGSGATEFTTCRVGAVINGESEITWGEWLPSASVTTRNSPLWKTNVKQQMCYLQVKNWARIYCPSAILGVYTTDELQDIPSEKDITPSSKSAPQDSSKVMLTDDEFAENADKWKKTYFKGVKAGNTIEQFYQWIEQKGKSLSDAHKKEIGLWKEPAVIEGESTRVDDFLGEMAQEETENANS